MDIAQARLRPGSGFIQWLIKITPTFKAFVKYLFRYYFHTTLSETFLGENMGFPSWTPYAWENLGVSQVDNGHPFSVKF